MEAGGSSSNGVGVNSMSSHITPVSSSAHPSESSNRARTAASAVSFNHLLLCLLGECR